MEECKHTTNMYVEKDAPIALWPDGSVRYLTYRCSKCKERIYKEHPWDAEWKVCKKIA